MKHFKRLNQYKASNVTLNVSDLQAYSYGWWRFTEVIGGLLVFNNYTYSSSTGGHQRKVRGVLSRDLAKKIDLEIEFPSGLQADNCYENAMAHYLGKIQDLQELINKRGSKRSSNTDRLERIAFYREQIELISGLAHIKAGDEAKGLSIIQNIQAKRQAERLNHLLLAKALNDIIKEEEGEQSPYWELEYFIEENTELLTEAA